MQIVIDIPDDVYNDIKSGKNIINITLNETPLPKGHGRLIDERDLKTLFGLDDRLWWENAVEKFADLPTIVKADKGSDTDGNSN